MKCPFVRNDCFEHNLIKMFDSVNEEASANYNPLDKSEK